MKLMQIVWTYAEPLSVIVFLLYFGATILSLKKYKSTHAAKLHTKDKQTVIRWIEALLFAMGILAITWPITVLAPDLFGAPFGEHYYPVELALVVFNYWVVFYGYHKVKIISLKNTSGPHSHSSEETEKNLNRLQKAMQEEKLYLDPELSINKLASLTGISAKTTSAILNQYHQVNFNDFVNSYRIKEVQERLADRGNQHLTIAGIALDCGFNSQATFQRVFKNTTGKSPRDFMYQSLQKTA
jgi:AraC-like DNA-binding protein